MTKANDKIAELRPKWWPAWTDYPHGDLSNPQARELSRYCVDLEMELAEARKNIERLERIVDGIDREMLGHAKESK